MLAIIIILHKMELGAYTVDQLGGREQKEADNFGNMFCCIAWLLDVEHFSHFSTSNSWKVARLFFVFSVKWSSPQINDIIADGTIFSWGIKIWVCHQKSAWQRNEIERKFGWHAPSINIDKRKSNNGQWYNTTIMIHRELTKEMQ